jgi:hypothetical protein
MYYININDKISKKLFLYYNEQKYSWELHQPQSKEIIMEYNCLFQKKQNFNYNKEIDNIFFNQTVCDYSSIVKVFDIRKPKNHNNDFN